VRVLTARGDVFTVVETDVRLSDVGPAMVVGRRSAGVSQRRQNQYEVSEIANAVDNDLFGWTLLLSR
jgi:hypothetical protein